MTYENVITLHLHLTLHYFSLPCDIGLRVKNRCPYQDYVTGQGDQPAGKDPTTLVSSNGQSRQILLRISQNLQFSLVVVGYHVASTELDGPTCIDSRQIHSFFDFAMPMADSKKQIKHRFSIY
ncbi:Protein of unknown function [Pyronema omphalodes CBS 100304]|uniref:Uncharacterized protein n=1 Tax=Pyronema omphalodes (strain CBS 100304) TaxID=1076935 RepID=U4L575_PYROM|nr:Protein of unknown function [Pyronema omphalodes CBS 100304]